MDPLMGETLFNTEIEAAIAGVAEAVHDIPGQRGHEGTTKDCQACKRIRSGIREATAIEVLR